MFAFVWFFYMLYQSSYNIWNNGLFHVLWEFHAYNYENTTEVLKSVNNISIDKY